MQEGLVLKVCWGGRWKQVSCHAAVEIAKLQQEVSDLKEREADYSERARKREEDENKREAEARLNADAEVPRSANWADSLNGKPRESHNVKARVAELDAKIDGRTANQGSDEDQVRAFPLEQIHARVKRCRFSGGGCNSGCREALAGSDRLGYPGCQRGHLDVSERSFPCQ